MSTVLAELPEIDFEGKLVKPVRGKYKCPHGCHNPNFPAPSWKTEAGFRKHMTCCLGTPSARKRQADLELARSAGAEASAAIAAAQMGLSIGDNVFHVGYTVTAPTHVQRGSRLVKLRYEESRRYYGAAARIVSFGWAGGLVINGGIAARDLCDSLMEAEAKAAEAQLQYDSHVEIAAATR